VIYDSIVVQLMFVMYFTLRRMQLLICLQIYISIICAAITTPPIMLIVYIFQHTRRRKQTNDDHKKRGNTCCRKQRSATNEDRLREIQLSSETPELNAGLVFPFW
jgi:hypothetical protein